MLYRKRFILGVYVFAYIYGRYVHNPKGQRGDCGIVSPNWTHKPTHMYM